MRISLIALLVIFYAQSFAQTLVSSTIESVTVFREQAAITRIAKANAALGTQEIVLTGLSNSLNPASLRVKLSGKNSKLVSVYYETKYKLEKPILKNNEQLRWVLEQKYDSLKALYDRKEVLKEVEGIFRKSKEMDRSTKGFTTAELLDFSQHYQRKVLNIKQEFRSIDKKEKEINVRINEVKTVLKESKGIPNKEMVASIVLKIQTSKAEKVQVSCTYMVDRAGWTPLYDIRSEGVTKQAQLTYKAAVHRATGQDWKNVALTVSTGNPVHGNDRPILRPLYATILKGGYKIDRYELNLNMAYTTPTTDSFTALSTPTNSDQLNSELLAPMKESILNGDEPKIVWFTSVEVATEYVYHTVPKLNKSAFLLAKISGWNQHNLGAGKVAVFFHDTFAGETVLQAPHGSDTLLVSMGRDQSIIVDRKVVDQSVANSLLGATKKETLTYEITVTNQKGVPIAIEILDQIPLTNNELIEVELIQQGKATYQAATGKLLWKLTIPANGTQKKQFSYAIKYPKKEAVTGVR